jgi:hypothetical protein
MALSWSGRRQLLYYGAAALVFLVFAAGVWQAFFSTAPSCFNGKQDGDETGVDCGGSCALICAAQAAAPTVLWARAFRTGATTYTAAAYIENNNPGAGARGVSYSFQLFDADNQLIVERDGTTDLPPVVDIPIIETGINTGSRTVARTLFAFSATPVWQKVPPANFVIPAITQPSHSADYSTLSATITNNTLAAAPNLTVVAVLYDVQGVARAASKSVLSVPGQSSMPVVFTWPYGIATPQGPIVKAEISVLPSF